MRLGDARKLVDQLDESQPATTLIDRPIRPTSPAADLWAAHQARVRDQAAHLSSPSLFKQVQSADPLALRFVAPALVLAAGIHAGPSATQRLLAGIDPDFGAIVGADKLTAQAWVAPPGYTNRAPFILEDGARNAAPDGSELTIRVDARSAPTLIVVEGDDTTRRKLTLLERPDMVPVLLRAAEGSGLRSSEHTRVSALKAMEDLLMLDGEMPVETQEKLTEKESIVRIVNILRVEEDQELLTSILRVVRLLSSKARAFKRLLVENEGLSILLQHSLLLS